MKPVTSASYSSIKKPGAEFAPDWCRNCTSLEFESLFSRLPATILTDPKLKPSDKILYASIALACGRGSSCSESLHNLGRFCGLSRRQSILSAQHLAEHGYLKRSGGERKLNEFELTSPVFSTTCSTADASPKKAESTACARCDSTRIPVGQSGVCKACVKDEADLRRWQSARAELGAGATREQIMAYLNSQPTRRWKRIARLAEAA